MKIKDLKINSTYRHRDNPSIGYAKLIELMPPKKGFNTTGKWIAKCEWCSDDKFLVCIIKRFAASDLVELK